MNPDEFVINSRSLETDLPIIQVLQAVTNYQDRLTGNSFSPAAPYNSSFKGIEELILPLHYQLILRKICEINYLFPRIEPGASRTRGDYAIHSASGTCHWPESDYQPDASPCSTKGQWKCGIRQGVPEFTRVRDEKFRIRANSSINRDKQNRGEKEASRVQRGRGSRNGMQLARSEDQLVLKQRYRIARDATFQR